MYFVIDGAPCAVKVACTVWSGGKGGDYFKALPIAMHGDEYGNVGRHRKVLCVNIFIDINCVELHNKVVFFRIL